MDDQQLMLAVGPLVGAKMTDYSDRTPDHWIIERPFESRRWHKWEPLADDGDAFRLAVREGIFEIQHNALFRRLYSEALEEDRRPTEATRYAIVRAVYRIHAGKTGKPVPSEPSPNGQAIAQAMKAAQEAQPTYNTVTFGSLNVGDEFYGYGDMLINYDYPKWCHCKKTDHQTGKEIDGCMFLINANDEVFVEVKDEKVEQTEKADD